jgi:hypothetical protein
MNADSQIIHFSLTGNPRPTVLKFGGDFYGHGLAGWGAQRQATRARVGLARSRGGLGSQQTGCRLRRGVAESE